ncbi:MAG: replication-associated recombination protein A [Micrococcales bacterium]
MSSGLYSALAPLASRMRPTQISEVVGQNHLLQPGAPLTKLAEPLGESTTASTTSVILWGPPGTGKTSLAKAIAQSSSRRFIELSAVTAGVKDVREAMEQARTDRDGFGHSTILFLDEIHRFSKAQQDALLPGVEGGWVVLIAATTENPSFSVISPLLSRSLLLTLKPLTDADLAGLLERALQSERGLAGRYELAAEQRDQIVAISGGDARRSLTILEAASLAAEARDSNQITAADIEISMDRALVRYDRDGDQHYDVISAFIKSVRGSDADAATHYLARMLEAGEDPRFIGRRLIILAAEDIGLADPQALPLAVAAAEAVAKIGMPEGRIPLAEATIYLALAPKSNTAYNAINEAIQDVRAGRIGAVPLPLRSSNYAGAAKTTGAGKGYVYPHDDSRAVVEQQYLDERLAGASYYQPKALGAEAEIGARHSKLRSIIRAFKRK